MCWCVVLLAADCPNEMLTRSLDVEQAGASSIELALLSYAFWQEDGFKYRSRHLLQRNHQKNLLGKPPDTELPGFVLYTSWPMSEPRACLPFRSP
jgi:hypothetical protein